jgi:hypothetical protein
MRWVLDMIVVNNFCGSEQIKINKVDEGGSSSVFNKAFPDDRFSVSAFQINTILNGASKGFRLIF